MHVLPESPERPRCEMVTTTEHSKSMWTTECSTHLRSNPLSSCKIWLPCNRVEKRKTPGQKPLWRQVSELMGWLQVDTAFHKHGIPAGVAVALGSAASTVAAMVAQVPCVFTVEKGQKCGIEPLSRILQGNPEINRRCAPIMCVPRQALGRRSSSGHC